MTSPDPTTPRPTVARRPGDRVIRRGVLQRETYRVRQPVFRRRQRHPAVALVLGFVVLILIGTILLSTPLASTSGSWISPLIALFTATSAVCVTGLVVVDTATHWSTFGEVVILALIQLGGFGFLTSSTLLLILAGRRTSLRGRLALGQAMAIDFPGEALPLVRRIGLTAAAIELIGVLLLLPRFLAVTSVGSAIWWSLFHSVSAFNNAGMDLMGGFRSLSAFQHDEWALGVIGMLIILGGVSYAVMADVYRVRRWARLRLDTKLVLATSGALLLVGTVAMLVLEGSNPATLGLLSWFDKVINAIFLSITPRTAGFAPIDFGQAHDQTIFFTVPLMFIGGATGSTAGGIKLQTFSVLLFAILAALRGNQHAVAFGREIPHVQVYRALAIALMSVALVFAVAFTLTLTETAPFLDILFETVSAFGTVGLSTGITPTLSTVGRLIIIAVMFIGRLGPLSVALALVARMGRDQLRHARESVRIG